MHFVDTNVFIRYFTSDDPTKAEAAKQLLQKAQRREIELALSKVVVVEMVQILSSKALYNLPREEVRKRVQAVLLVDNLRLDNKPVYFQALDLYAKHTIDFADCIIAAKVQQGQHLAVYSYDRDFDKLGSFRLEP